MSNQGFLDDAGDKPIAVDDGITWWGTRLLD